MNIVKKILTLALITVIYLKTAGFVTAVDSRVLGIHILNTNELDQVEELFASDSQDQEWRYVTIPLGLDQLDKKQEWQDFFNKAREAKIKPIVRLTTRFENGAWKVPNKKEITDLIGFLSKLDWPTDEKYIVVLNEPNHAAEFGGQIDPIGYERALEFTSNWAHSENLNYKVLPAAMDLAADGNNGTMEAFAYLNGMLAENPDVFNNVDYWNSHSYPNPGFSTSPERTDKKSLRGFEHELDFIKDKTGRDLQVFITETGWQDNYLTKSWLDKYYEYALQHIWSDSRVVAVTPFILKGSPGPFSSFSFLDANDQPTRQYLAYRKLIEKY